MPRSIKARPESVGPLGGLRPGPMVGWVGQARPGHFLNQELLGIMRSRWFKAAQPSEGPAAGDVLGPGCLAEGQSGAVVLAVV